VCSNFIIPSFSPKLASGFGCIFYVLVPKYNHVNHRMAAALSPEITRSTRSSNIIFWQSLSLSHISVCMSLICIVRSNILQLVWFLMIFMTHLVSFLLVLSSVQMDLVESSRCTGAHESNYGADVRYVMLIRDYWRNMALKCLDLLAIQILICIGEAMRIYQRSSSSQGNSS
jgi:hypothetical protein